MGSENIASWIQTLIAHMSTTVHFSHVYDFVAVVTDKDFWLKILIWPQ